MPTSLVVVTKAVLEILSWNTRLREHVRQTDGNARLDVDLCLTHSVRIAGPRITNFTPSLAPRCVIRASV